MSVVRVTDPVGNRTRDRVVPVTSGAPPSAPLNLVASPGAGANEVVVTWDANPEPDVVGYRVWRDGSRLRLHATCPERDDALVLTHATAVLAG